MKHNIRDKSGKFAAIVAGRLYGYRGGVVRACKKCANGKRHVSFHKQLHGFMDESELQRIESDKVQAYLQDVAN